MNCAHRTQNRCCKYAKFINITGVKMSLLLSTIKASSVDALVNAATTDPNFAKELKAAAQAAQQAGVGSKEWDALMSKFFSDPNDLAILRLTQTGDPRILPQWTPTTITTITTITTAF
jgi:hypothetical protein